MEGSAANHGADEIKGTADIELAGPDDGKVNHTIDTDSVVDEARLGHLEAIAKRNMEQDAKYFKDFDGEKIVESETPSDGDQKKEDTPEKEEGTAKAAEDPVEEFVTIRVDGKDQQVPLSKIKEAGIRSYQMESAADWRLEEAKKILKEAKEHQKAYSRPEEPEKEKPTLSPTDAARAALEVHRKALVNAQIHGTPEEMEMAFGAYEASREALETARLNEITGGGSVSEAVARELQRREQESVKARNKIILEKLSQPVESGGYKDLLDNEELREFFIIRVNKAFENGKPNEYETYAEIGSGIRKMLGLSNEEQPPAEQKKKVPIDHDKLEARMERKQAEIDNIKVSGGTPHGKTGDSDKPKDINEVRAKAMDYMFKSRGQGRW